MSWLVLSLALHAAATPATENPHLQRGIAQLNELDEAGALRTLEKARAWPRNTPHELALIHLYLGLAHAGLAHGKQAVEAFQSALLLEPELTLPADAGPRIHEWWVKAGGKEPPAAVKSPEPEPVVVAPKPVEPEPVVVAKPVEPAPVPVVVAETPAPRSRAPGFALGGGGLVLLGGGLGGLIYSLGVAGAYRAQQPDHAGVMAPTVSRADAALVSTLYPVSIAALALGAVLVGLAVALLAM